jgi:hypothetical protein
MMIRYILSATILAVGSLAAQEAPAKPVAAPEPAAPVKPAAAPKPAGPVKPIKPTPYREVAKHLNPDGDYYLYLNSEQLGRSMVKLSNLLETAVKADEREPEGKKRPPRHSRSSDP